MSRAQLELDQAKRVEAEVIALALLEPAALRSRFEAILELVPVQRATGGSGAPGAAAHDAAAHDAGARATLRHFAESCLRHDFDVDAVLDDVRQREEGAYVLQRLLEGESDEDGRIDVEGQLAKALSRLRELALEGRKEDSRSRLQRRREEIARLLSELQDGGVDDADRARLDELYRELKEIQGVLAAREAERRSRVMPTTVRARKRGL